ncbi:MAG TPA: SRPBCC domain-containing protein [Flavisolibacter sp.]|nr:SRPBCC domain-containing protein [Flavisolibacter sp.]
MNTHNFETTILVDQSPQEVFDAINNVRGWWSGEIEGLTDTPGAEFTYAVPGVHYSRQRITEFIPGKKIVWSVVDANLSFVKNKTEWKGTSISFIIAQKGDQTEVRFTHAGLEPAHECYKDCSNAWRLLINGNLRNLIVSGEHQPSPW